MPSTSAPFGFKPIFHPTGNSRATAYPGVISSAYNTSLYRGQPVKLATDGTLAVAGATGAIIGVFDGVEYTDSTGKRNVSTYWPANTVATDTVAYVWDDASTVFEVQADGVVAQTALGDQANNSNLSNGSTYSGQSHATLSASLVGAGSNGQFRVIGKSLRSDNDWGDAYTIVQVQIAQHQYVSAAAAI
jgi:hypothetical protein